MKFKFNLERKITMWVREHHEIEAETKEQAEIIMLRNIEEDETDTSFIVQEEMFDTITDTEDFEVYDEEGIMIYENLP
jgi:hypothetical protein